MQGRSNGDARRSRRPHPRGRSATVRRDGAAATHLEFDRTLDPELGYRCGTALETDLRAGDRLFIATETPPQVARHEGYEHAFLEMETVSFTV